MRIASLSLVAWSKSWTKHLGTTKLTCVSKLKTVWSTSTKRRIASNKLQPQKCLSQEISIDSAMINSIRMMQNENANFVVNLFFLDEKTKENILLKLIIIIKFVD